MKQRITYLLSLSLLFLGSCNYNWHNGFYQVDQSYSTESITIDPANFYYLRLCEIYEADSMLDSNNGNVVHDANLILAYENCPCDYSQPTETEKAVVEETYLYMDNYDPTDNSEITERLIYINTVRFEGDPALLNHYSDNRQLNLLTAKETIFGWWTRKLDDQGKPYLLLELRNPEKAFQVKAIPNGKSIAFTEITHPAVNKYSLRGETLPFIPIQQVYHLREDKYGITFHQNEGRQIVVMDPALNVTSIDLSYQLKYPANHKHHGTDKQEAKKASYYLKTSRATLKNHRLHDVWALPK